MFQYNFALNFEPILLLLDLFIEHNTEEVQGAARTLNVTIISKPTGLNSKTQPSDVSWNKRFKGYMPPKLEN